MGTLSEGVQETHRLWSDHRRFLRDNGCVTTVRSTAYSAISSASRVEILHLVQQRARRTLAELTDATGLHANTVREHVQRLIDDGYMVAEPERRTTRGRPRVLYSAATDTPSDVQARRVAAAAERGDLMRRVLPATSPTHLDTDALHQIDAIVEDLMDAGFDPIVDEDELTIDLTPCAHAAAQAEHRELLCRVHLGLMQGVLDAAGGPLSVDGMRSSCDPEQCVVQLMLAERATKVASDQPAA